MKIFKLLAFLMLFFTLSIHPMELPELTQNQHIETFDKFCKEGNFSQAANYFAQYLLNDENIENSPGYINLLNLIHNLINQNNGSALSSFISFLDIDSDLYTSCNEIINKCMSHNQLVGKSGELRKQPGFMTIDEQDAEVENAITTANTNPAPKTIQKLFTLLEKYKENRIQEPKITNALKKHGYLVNQTEKTETNTDIKVAINKKEFTIPLACAKLSGTLNSLMDEFETTSDVALPLHSAISSTIFIFVLDSLKKYVENPLCKTYTDELKKLSLDDLIEVINAVNYLDIQLLLNPLCETIVNRLIQEENLKSFNSSPVFRARLQKLNKNCQEKVAQQLSNLCALPVIAKKRASCNAYYSLWTNGVIGFPRHQTMHFFNDTLTDSLIFSCINQNYINFFKVKNNGHLENIDLKISQDCDIVNFTINADGTLIGILNENSFEVYSLDFVTLQAIRKLQLPGRNVRCLEFLDNNTLLVIEELNIYTMDLTTKTKTKIKNNTYGNFKFCLNEAKTSCIIECEMLLLESPFKTRSSIPLSWNTQLLKAEKSHKGIGGIFVSNNQIACISDKKSVIIYDVTDAQSPKELRTLCSQESEIRQLKVIKGILYALDYNGCVTMYDLESGSTLGHINDNIKYCSIAAYNNLLSLQTDFGEEKGTSIYTLNQVEQFKNLELALLYYALSKNIITLDSLDQELQKLFNDLPEILKGKFTKK